MIATFKTVDPMVPVERGGWLGVVSGELREQFESRYQQGAKEHGCDLGELPTAKLLDEVNRETLDIYAYLQKLRRREIGLALRPMTNADLCVIRDAIEFLKWTRKWVPHKRQTADALIVKLEAICQGE